MNTTAHALDAIDLTDDADLVIYEFDRPSPADLGVAAFCVHTMWAAASSALRLPTALAA